MGKNWLCRGWWRDGKTLEVPCCCLSHEESSSCPRERNPSLYKTQLSTMRGSGLQVALVDVGRVPCGNWSLFRAVQPSADRDHPFSPNLLLPLC